MKTMNFRAEIFKLFSAKWLNFLVCCLEVTLILSITAKASDQVYPEDVKKSLKQAEKLRKNGNLAEAETVLRRAIEIYPNNSKVKLELAYILMKQRRLLEAYEISFEIAKNEPQNSYALAVVGLTLLNAGNFRQSEIILNKSLDLNRREALAWAGLGLLDFYENRISDSLDAMRNAVYLESDEPDFVFSLAQIAARAEKYKEAAQAYRDFLRISSPRDKERRERIKGLIDFLDFLGGRAVLYDIGGKRQTVVKIEMVKDRPVVQLRLNKSRETYNFVLDTGSGISVISQKTAERLRISEVARGGRAKGFGGDGTFEIVYGFLNRVDIGEVSIRNVPVYIRSFHSVNEGIDGYIGLSLISKFLTTIDYGESTFTLLKKDSQREQFDENSGLVIPLRLTSGGFLSGQVQVEGIESPLNFIVDTGASLSVISNEIASLKEMSRFVVKEKIRVVGAAGETDEMPVIILPRVTVGNESRQSVVAVALDLRMINESSGFEQSGILGGNFLKNFKMTFDFQNSKVLFVPLSR